MNPLEVKAFEVLDDERLGQGGYLLLRRLRLRLVRADGTRTADGLWDYVERPAGLDAVVVALWRRRRDGAVEVLLRAGVRVPLHFGRPEKPSRFLLPELVAGIVEPGDDLAQRAALEAMEEAGLALLPAYDLLRNRQSVLQRRRIGLLGFLHKLLHL